VGNRHLARLQSYQSLAEARILVVDGRTAIARARAVLAGRDAI